MKDLPLPPIHDVASHGWAMRVTAICVAIDIALLAWGLWTWRRQRRPVMLALLVGGLCTVVVEAPLDTLLMVYFPAHGQPTAYTTFGRPIPWWAVACYPILFGVMACTYYWIFESGKSKRYFWTLLMAGFALNILMEELLLPTGIYHYFGHQPFRIGPFPVHWSLLNNGASLLVAIIAFAFRRGLHGWRYGLLVPLFPCCQLGFLSFAGWPLASVMNTVSGQRSLLLLTGAGLVTVAMGLLVFQAIAELGCGDGRWRGRLEQPEDLSLSPTGALSVEPQSRPQARAGSGRRSAVRSAP